MLPGPLRANSRTAFHARVLALAVAASTVAGVAARDRVGHERLISDIRYLSSPELGGRGAGSAGLEKAGEYLAREFARAGLKPLMGGSYLQPFSITVGAVLGPENAVRYWIGGEQHTVDPDAFLPFNFSGIGKVSGAVLFAGYGISARECGYDDYQGVDATGKIVIVLRHEPQEYDQSSVFEGRIYTEHAQLLSKALNARRHGATAVIFVNDTASHTGPDTLEPFTDLPAPADAGIPFVQVKAEIVKSWIASAGGDLEKIQSAIDNDLKPRSFELGGDLRLELEVDLRREERTVHNVVGYLPGRTAEHVIIGAHYDHLGTGEQYSLAPNMAGTVHPGADDNASGAAALVAIARRFAGRPKPARGLLFIAFSGEELGLLGSAHYVRNPLLPLDRAAAMINMDMIGRVRDGKVIVGGARSGDNLRSIVELAAKEAGLQIDAEERVVYGSSDHTTFKAQLIPILFFFTGLHADYHRPTDTWERIDAKGTAQVVSLVADVAARLCRAAARPRFVPPPAVAVATSGENQSESGVSKKNSHGPSDLDR